jgi:hypothetical protein
MTANDANHNHNERLKMAATFQDVNIGNRIATGMKVCFTSPKSGRKYTGWIVRVRTSIKTQSQNQRGDLATVQLDAMEKEYRTFYDCEAEWYEVDDGT